ncbi:MAG: glycosyltransferase family 9 protein, partial [Planctomycetes bacterium]|nr:glycosyltransferase family 9 protein [Planctomycetota bacterium]
NDSGISHLAASVGTPTVAIFGPTSAATWSPRGKCVAIVEGKASCAPCPDDQRRACTDPKCIASVKAADVIKAMRDLLARGPEDRASLDDADSG